MKPKNKMSFLYILHFVHMVPSSEEAARGNWYRGDRTNVNKYAQNLLVKHAQISNIYTCITVHNTKVSTNTCSVCNSSNSNIK